MVGMHYKRLAEAKDAEIQEAVERERAECATICIRIIESPLMCVSPTEGQIVLDRIRARGKGAR